jgi:hypothetical protein
MPKFKVDLENCSKVTVSGNEFPIIISYLRNRTPLNPATSEVANKERGRPFGAIVAIDKDHIGWSLCHRYDSWDREKAVKIAAGRAMRGTNYWYETFEDYTKEDGEMLLEFGDISKSGLPKLSAVLRGMKEMEVRAARYFKE